MAYIDNSETIKNLNDSIRGNAVSNLAPTQLSKEVMPVIDINPNTNKKNNIVRGASSANTGSIVGYTTPTDKDFYLTNISMSYVKNATCDIATGGYGAYVNMWGESGIQSLHQFALLTTTAQSDGISIELANPIRLQRGTNIIFDGTFTAGALMRTINVSGYIE